MSGRPGARHIDLRAALLDLRGTVGIASEHIDDDFSRLRETVDRCHRMIDARIAECIEALSPAADAPRYETDHPGWPYEELR